MIEIYSGAGAYVLPRAEDWIFVHEVLPDPWFIASGSGLTCWLRPWAKLPTGAVWVPTVRAIGRPWRYSTKGPEPDRALPRNSGGEPMVLQGPVHCKWTEAQTAFRLLVGEAALEATQTAIRVNMFARMLLEGHSPVAIAARDARIAIASVNWEARWHADQWVMVASTEDKNRWLAAVDDWVAAASTEDETINLILRAEEEFKATADY